MQQISFTDAEFTNKKRKTRREKFLDEMERAVPWKELEAVIEPHNWHDGWIGAPNMGGKYSNWRKSERYLIKTGLFLPVRPIFRQLRKIGGEWATYSDVP